MSSNTSMGPVSGKDGKKPIPISSIVSDSLTYPSLVRDFNKFRMSARTDIYDMPGQVFFRVLFHFDNRSDAEEYVPGTEKSQSSDTQSSAWTGLIAPSWFDFNENGAFMDKDENITRENLEILWRSSTAFNYLVLNGENKRARMLKQFVELLSNISTNSPWYFQNIKGIDTAIERSVTNGDFTFKEERDKISIECLDDSYDQRIGTLLDLYRAVVWSWETKREMVPRNLRKFDMTIIAFQMPLRGLHVSRNSLKLSDTVRASLESETANNFAIKDVLMTAGGPVAVYSDGLIKACASYKAWEFHGCEIDYTSSKSGWGELNNAEGTVPKYTIDILFDDVYETRFNEFINGEKLITDNMGDNFARVMTDDLEVNTLEPPIADPEKLDYASPNELRIGTKPNNLGRLKGHKGPRSKSGLIEQAIGAGKSWAETKLKKLYLGNMNGLSLSTIRSQVGMALDGDLWGTVNNVKKAVQGNWNGGNVKLGENIFPTPEPTPERIIQLGNIYKVNSALNS